jgi:hypothetical protein
MSHALALSGSEKRLVPFASSLDATAGKHGQTSPRWLRLAKVFAIAAVLAAGYALIVKRVALVSTFPALASFYKAVGHPVNIYRADFRNVRAYLEGSGREARLIVEGQIRNLSKAQNVVPDIRIEIRNESGLTTFSWLARLPDNRISPQGELSFRTSLDSPPPGQHRAILHFSK